MTKKYDDCLSCAFDDVENAICAQCIDGNWWEDADPEAEISTSTPKRTRIQMLYGKKRKEHSNEG